MEKLYPKLIIEDNKKQKKSTKLGKSSI